MPSPSFLGPLRFSRDIVEDQSDELGCFALISGDNWIYVGSGEIRKSLLDLLDGSLPEVIQAAPTHFIFSIRENPEKMAERLIAQFKPICNQHAD